MSSRVTKGIETSCAGSLPGLARKRRPPRKLSGDGPPTDRGAVDGNPFEPLVPRWFADQCGEPTLGQQQGWEAIGSGRHTLIAAPTGSGKTLAAFLTALDALFQEGLRGPLPDEVRVVYVSPLKALSTDIHRNLALPRRGIAERAAASGVDAPRITAAVR